jgi:hypothetical protein
MSNYVIYVKSCHSCQIMSFMSNHVIRVKSCHSCQIMSLMSNHVIHIKSCHSCEIMSFMSKRAIHVKSCKSFVIWTFSEQTFSQVGREGGREFMSNYVIHVKSCSSCQIMGALTPINQNAIKQGKCGNLERVQTDSVKSESDQTQFEQIWNPVKQNAVNQT